MDVSSKMKERKKFTGQRPEVVSLVIKEGIGIVEFNISLDTV